MTGIGHRLRTERLQRRLSQADLATLSGVSLLTINRIEHDKVNPRLATLRKLSAALDVPEELLAYGSRIQPLPEEGEAAEYQTLANQMVASSEDLLDRLRTLSGSEALSAKELAKVHREIPRMERHLRQMQQLRDKLARIRD